MRRLLVILSVWVFGLLGAAAPAMAAPAQAVKAPKPLYRDPVYDGAADVSLVYDRGHHVWKMFYTNRRASLKFPDRRDVAWVHATPIGVATSKDGMKWTYDGMAKFPAECTGETLWAPELYYEAGTYHMWLTIVPGVFHAWGGGATSKIVHLTSPDLASWSCSDALSTGSERIIDATVIKLPSGGYRLWYKDERAGSRLFAIDSPDLKTWTKVLDKPVLDTNAEGPKVFFFKGYYWMVADKWDGLLVLRSEDAATWTLQEDHILKEPGKQPTDTGKGQHPDVIVNGEGDKQRAFIYYFVHQGGEPEAKTDPYWNQRTVVQVAELKFADGKLSVDREATVTTPLVAPKDK